MLKRVLKEVSVLVPVVGALATSSLAGAVSVGAGAGVVNGAWFSSPGYALPPAAVSPQAVTFSGAIDGVFLGGDTSSATAQGCVTTNMSANGVTGAGSNLGDIAVDFGNVNGFVAGGTCNVVGGGAPVTIAVNGGAFVRLHDFLIMVFPGNQCTIGIVASSCELAFVGALIPANPTQNPLQDFAFHGVFSVAG